MTVKMIAERRTGRLLGVQIVGYEGSAKRIRHGCDGAVEPHDGRGDHGPGPRVRPAVLPVWDPILVAARQAAAAVRQAEQAGARDPPPASAGRRVLTALRTASTVVGALIAGRRAVAGPLVRG